MRLALSMSDQRIRRALLVVPLSILVTGCAETLVYGERSGFNLAIRVDPAQSAPLEVNGGIQRRVVGIIPPQKRTSANGKSDSEAVNMLSNFSLDYDEDDSSLFGGELSIRTAFASGKAALNVAGSSNATEVVATITGASERKKTRDQLESKLLTCFFPDGNATKKAEFSKAVDNLPDNFDKEDLKEQYETPSKLGDEFEANFDLPAFLYVASKDANVC